MSRGFAVRCPALYQRYARAFLVTGLVATMTSAADAETWPSTDGLYRLAFESEIDPIVINRLHRWTLTLTDRNGEPVEDAGIVVVGGMPEHDHGLPTRPEVTRELGDGRYLLEGMRFHMQGYWEIEVAIDAASGSDTVLLRLDIDR